MYARVAVTPPPSALPPSSMSPSPSTPHSPERARETGGLAPSNNTANGVAEAADVLVTACDDDPRCHLFRLHRAVPFSLPHSAGARTGDSDDGLLLVFHCFSPGCRFLDVLNCEVRAASDEEAATSAERGSGGNPMVQVSPSTTRDTITSPADSSFATMPPPPNTTATRTVRLSFFSYTTAMCPPCCPGGLILAWLFAWWPVHDFSKNAEHIRDLLCAASLKPPLRGRPQSAANPFKVVGGGWQGLLEEVASGSSSGESRRNGSMLIDA